MVQNAGPKTLSDEGGGMKKPRYGRRTPVRGPLGFSDGRWGRRQLISARQNASDGDILYRRT